MTAVDGAQAKPLIDLSEQMEFCLGRARVRPALGEVVCGETRVVLQRRIMQVLVALASAEGEIVSRDALIARCWGQVNVGEDALNRCIQRLRQLAVEMPDTFQIETRLRVGYRLVGAPAAGETGAAAGPATRRSLRVPLALAGVAALTAAAAVAIVLGLAGRAPHGGVAIRSFIVTDGGAPVQRFVAGAVYATAGALADADVGVVQPGHASAERRAEFVLDGRAGLHQGRIDLDVELVDARDGQVLWSKGFERAANLSEPLQEQVAAKLTDVLHCALDTSKYGGRPIDRGVLKLYLRACDLQRDGTALAEVRNLFRQVTEHEPRFAYGWSHLAFAAANDAFVLSPDDSDAARRQAQAAAQMALRLNPKDGLAYEALADLAFGRTTFAHIYDLFQRGLSVDPDNPDLLDDEGELMLRIGRIQDSIALLRRSLALDPLAPNHLAALVDALIDAGRLGEAHAELARGLRLWPDSDELKSDYVSMALRNDPPQPSRFGADPALSQTSISDAMQASNQRLLAVRAAPTLTHLQAFVAAELADLQAARLLPDRVILDLTTVGETAPALEVAERLGTGGAAYRVPAFDPEIFWRPFAESLRDDPRFIEIARRLGLVDFWMSTGRWPDFCERRDLSYACKSDRPAKRAAGDEHAARS